MRSKMGYYSINIKHIAFIPSWIFSCSQEYY
nr:MAG TPA: hypothetical protein [Caudoviricetes sp.]